MLQPNDWIILKNGLITDCHLVVQTPNRLISQSTFSACTHLLSVSFPEIISIEEYAFVNCSNLTSISFPKVSIIGIHAFERCNINTVFFPEATILKDACFAYCNNLTTASFPKVTTLGTGIFISCTNLTSAFFPEATSSGEYTFLICSSLAAISFPKAISIGNYAFYHCNSLTGASFPEATSIGDEAFNNCSSLLSLVLGQQPPIIGTNVFNNVSALLLVVPDSTIYSPTVLTDYPAGTEAFNKSVAMESGVLVDGSGLSLTPNRIPTLTGGYYQWGKDGIAIAGVTGTNYQATSRGAYTFQYIRGGQSVILLSIRLATNPYDLYGFNNRYQGCENILQLDFIPSTSNRTVEVWSEGTGAAYVFDPASKQYFKNKVTYNLPAGKSVITLRYDLDVDVKDASLVTFVYQISGGTEERTDVYTLYAKPEIKLIKYHPTTVLFNGILDISITNGSYYIQRSLDNGQSWQFARDTISGELLPFSQSQIAEFNLGDSILFRQPNGCGYEKLIVGHPGENDPPVRTITMPSINEAICNVPEGSYSIKSGDNFTFTITPTGSNIGKTLHVTTSRTLVPDSEGVSMIENQDGSFTVTILHIREEVIVTIDFATGTESIIGNVVIWSYANHLYIHSTETADVFVYTISGLLVKKVRPVAGETVTLLLSKGLYVVKSHGKTHKIIIS